MDHRCGAWVMLDVRVEVSFFFSSGGRHTRCALVTGVQTCALPICGDVEIENPMQPLGEAEIARLVPPGATLTREVDANSTMAANGRRVAVVLKDRQSVV